jgi:hypothetical protein
MSRKIFYIAEDENSHLMPTTIDDDVIITPPHPPHLSIFAILCHKTSGISKSLSVLSGCETKAEKWK